MYMYSSVIDRQDIETEIIFKKAMMKLTNNAKRFMGIAGKANGPLQPGDAVDALEVKVNDRDVWQFIKGDPSARIMGNTVVFLGDIGQMLQDLIDSGLVSGTDISKIPDTADVFLFTIG